MNARNAAAGLSKRDCDKAAGLSRATELGLVFRCVKFFGIDPKFPCDIRAEFRMSFDSFDPRLSTSVNAWKDRRRSTFVGRQFDELAGRLAAQHCVARMTRVSIDVRTKRVQNVNRIV